MRVAEWSEKAGSHLRRLPLASFWIFGVKQAWAALFGGLMLLALVFTAYVDLPWMGRYDWLFVIAIGIQLFMVATKLETTHELIAIVCFHITGLAMELFKTSSSIGSWTYPGDAFFQIGNVPLFSGFMYAAVGSYIARSWRVMHLTFDSYPNRFATALLAIAIYVNFFTHHYFYDFRLFLFVAIFGLYRLRMVRYRVNNVERAMPIVLSFFLIALFIWLAENISTFVDVWRYPNQESGWDLVSVHKLGSWTLLMVISFIMVETMYYAKGRFLAPEAAEGLTDPAIGVNREA